LLIDVILDKVSLGNELSVIFSVLAIFIYWFEED